MRTRKSEKGFTIIELVVVILLLGILTATALPRFMDITEEAHDAVVQGVLGGLNTGVALSRATWFGQGRSAGAISGLGNDQIVLVNNRGYPTGVYNGAPTTGENCQTAYTNILQPGGRPTIGVVSADVGPIPSATDIPNYSNDFVAMVSSPVCFYVYTGEGSAVSSPVLYYDTVAGTVSLSSAEI